MPCLEPGLGLGPAHTSHFSLSCMHESLTLSSDELYVHSLMYRLSAQIMYYVSLNIKEWDLEMFLCFRFLLCRSRLKGRKLPNTLSSLMEGAQ